MISKKRYEITIITVLATALVLSLMITSKSHLPITGRATLPTNLGWYSIPNTHMRDVCPSSSNLGNCAQVIQAWGGGAVDTSRNRLIIWGGGHTDYYGNELYVLDLNSLAWQRLTNPSPRASDAETLSDGNPNSRHTYDGLAYIEHVDRLFSFGGSLAGGGNCAGSTWTFDFKTNKWQNMNPSNSPNSKCGAVSAYDPNTKQVFVHDGDNLYAYTFETNSYRQLSGYSETDYHMTAAIDPKRKKFVIVGGGWASNGGVFVYDIGSGSTYTMQKWSTTGGDAIVNSASPGLAYDPVSDRIIAWNGGSTIYSLNMDTKAWTSTTFSGGPGAASGEGTFGKWEYVPNLGVFVGVTNVDSNAYTLRLNSGISPQPSPTPAPAPQPSPAPAPQPSPSIPKNAFVGSYFDNMDFSNLKLTRTDPQIDFDWGTSTPHSLVGAETFSVRWEGDFDLTSGTYRFTATADDGIRIWIDGTLILDKWLDQSATIYTVDRTISSGTHRIKVDYYENGIDAVAKLSWPLVGSSPPPAPTPTPGPSPGWNLVWSDEFSYTGLPDSTKWGYDSNYGFGDQYFTKARSENVRVENGVLTIEARKESYQGAQYTSALIETRGKASWTYGRMEVRAKLPKGRGVWPAIWTLAVSGKWPAGGEIDIMEYVGFDPNKIYGNVHASEGGSHFQDGPTSYSVTSPWDSFHAYALEWFPDRMDFFVDGNKYYTYRNDGSNPWPFDQPQYLILNLAIGGEWGGQQGIDDSIFPQQYVIDYVRVYQQGTASPPPQPPPDSTLPAVSITSPVNSATVSGTITVSATASDNVAVTGVQFRVDGQNVGSEDATSPYSVSWNTASVANGLHTLTAVARDAAGNTKTSSGVGVTVNNAVTDTTPPTISNVAATIITTNSATIIWNTNEMSTHQVEYGLTTSYGSSTVENANLMTSHSQLLSGLQPNTLYHLRVKSKDSSGNLAISGDFSFRTLSSTVPTMSLQPSSQTINLGEQLRLDIVANNFIDLAGVQIDVNYNQNVLSYVRTDEGTFLNKGNAQTIFLGTINTAQPGLVNDIAIVRVNGGANGSGTIASVYFNAVNVGSSALNFGSILLSNSKSVIINASKINANVEVVNVQQPDTTPPTISNVQATSITQNSATIIWNTNEMSTHQVEYGTTVAYGSLTTENMNMMASHSQTLNNLNPNTLYHYRVKSKDANGNIATSNDFTFRTLSSSMPSLSLQPASQTVNVGNQVKVDVVVSNIKEMGGVQLSLSYNSNALGYIRTEEGNFLSSGNAQTIFLNTIDTSQSGFINDISIVRIGGGVNGSGTIASVYFNAKGAGSSSLNFVQVLLADTKGNVISINTVNASVNVQQTSQDTIPPIISNGLPTGTLPAGTTSTTVSMITNEGAICKYSTTPNTAYSSMPYTLATTNGLTHTALVVNLKSGTYSYYVRCKDNSQNQNTNDFLISFSIPLQTCTTQNGFVCASGKICPGTNLSATDTTRCCSQACVTPLWSLCSECGTGLFNFCDKVECYSISEECYFTGTLLDTCLPCSSASCESYNDQMTCNENNCGFQNCAWLSNECTTSDKAPPTISNVQATSITQNSATIIWNTNEMSTHQVEYGTTAAYGSLTTENMNMMTSHSQILNNLNPNTLYHYRVKSKDSNGNIAASGDFIFTTASPNLAAISLNPSSQILDMGEQLRLDIVANNFIDLAGVQIDVNYNQNVLSYVRTDEGTFLNKGNAQTIFLNTIDTSQSGFINDISIVRIGGGVNGSGTIASVYFNAVNVGSSALNFGSILLSNSKSVIINASKINANVEVLDFGGVSDSDNDGVPDAKDKCPYTGQNITVNKHGCPMPKHNKFSPELTTNFSEADLSNVTKLKLGIVGLGQIDFGDNWIVLLQQDSLGLFMSVDLDSFIEFLNNKVIIRSDLFRALNKSAIITLLNLTGITNPRILIDGIQCTECKILNFNYNSITFTVPHNTEHSVVEGSYCGDNFCSSQEGCSSCSTDCGICPSSSSSSGGSSGGGGSSSGGGGGGSWGGGIGSFVCNQEWRCGEWSSCNNGWQTRQCDFVKFPQHFSETGCPSLSDAPSTSKICEATQQQSSQTSVQQGTIQPTGDLEQSQLEKEQERSTQKEPEISEKTERNRVLSRGFLWGLALGLIIITGVMTLSYHLKSKEPKPFIADAKTAVSLGIDQRTLESAVNYINSMRRLGKSDQEIVKLFKEIGWDENIINKLLKRMS